MATKARFYEVVIRDGHGDHHHAYAAQSEADLRNNLQIHPLERLVSIDHLGFFYVEAEPDEDTDSVVFDTILPRGQWWCYIGELSYPHLLQQFSSDVGNIKEYFRLRNMPPDQF